MALVIIIAVLIIFWLIFRKKKQIKEPNVFCITGGVKTGKSTVAMYLARKRYKKHLILWKIKKIFCKLFKKPIPEKPLFYSNIKVAFDYVPVTKDILLRKERIRYKSVMLIDESSLVADSMDFKDYETNYDLKMFNKLYGHETKGGYLYYDTQVMRDNHYAIKRCMNSYLWIHHLIKWVPFVVLAKVQELFFSEDGERINVNNGDVEDELRWLIIPKKTWKTFDCYTYSVFTDDLPVADNVIHGHKKDLKTPYIVEIGAQKWKEAKALKERQEGLKNEREKNDNSRNI